MLTKVRVNVTVVRLRKVASELEKAQLELADLYEKASAIEREDILSPSLTRLENAYWETARALQKLSDVES